MTGDALTRLLAGLDQDEQLARAALGVEHVHYDGTAACVGERCIHDRRHPPARVLRQVEAIREKVTAPYLAAVDAVEATVSARQYAATRYTLAAMRLDHDSGDDERQTQERRAREELLSAEVQLASDVATRDAYASVIEALASIYTEDTA
ncbi:hypothetical protein [Nocardia niwae]|uniref:hypothetical protein n=1 Tax=Nocardia niwae TaxID=626084 RepID=UPI0007A4FA0D|nr:hypothetical protein [Nocardia niwae]